MADVSKRQARMYLEQCIGRDADFRPQQWEAIDCLVNHRDQVLLVQRTGWGKSTVYFIATRCLRDQGAGPTLIISPLLSLMRNQIADAEADLGLTAVTINSNNRDEWEEATTAVVNDDCDLLLISPERLASEAFMTDVLAEMEQRFGMLVVDEAHCISEWGHDFRPDYRRIKRIVQRLPGDTPVAATTATATDRVIDDITTQLPHVTVLRGSLVRDSLALQTLTLGEPERRLAWLAQHVPDLDGAGIIYCLTRDDVEIVASWLQDFGVDALAYHGRLDGERRHEREAQLMDNKVDCLVATNALGMGFNKPDLAYVIHFQRPPSIVRYYQEIGRAGRDLDRAYAILLTGERDDDIAEYFIENAFPAEGAFRGVLDLLEESDEPLYPYEILKRLNLSYADVETCLDMLRVEGAIFKGDNGYVPTGTAWEYDADRIDRVTEQRWRELDQIKSYVDTDECLLRFLDNMLDGSMTEDCGRCANCAGPLFPPTVEESDEQHRELVEDAREQYRQYGSRVIEPRKRLPEPEGTYSNLDATRQLEEGRALAVLSAPGWGTLVEEGREARRFDDELVEAAQALLDEWGQDPRPTWVTAVPSTSAPGSVVDVAERIADRVDLRFESVVEVSEKPDAQSDLANSYQQRWNILDVFSITEPVPDGPVLLVDDVVGSRWTFTEVGTRLRDAGSGPVYPLALADRRG